MLEYPNTICVYLTSIVDKKNAAFKPQWVNAKQPQMHLLQKKYKKCNAIFLWLMNLINSK